jgi:hypothetical protein
MGWTFDVFSSFLIALLESIKDKDGHFPVVEPLSNMVSFQKLFL